MLSRIGMYILHSSLVQMMRYLDVLSLLILLTLLFLSVICWTIFLYKWSLFFIRQKDLNRTFSRMHQKTAQEVIMWSKTALKSPSARIIAQISELPMTSSNTKAQFLQDVEPILEETLNQDEQYLFILLISAQIAPLLGLLGTIWGLIQAFINVGNRQSADIVVLAPGIAQALITTLAGLLVAIPAHAMYHTLAYKIRILEHRLYVLSYRMSMLLTPTF